MTYGEGNDAALLKLILSSTPEQQERYREALRGALLKGHAVLAAGGEAMDAAVAAVAFMEGEPICHSG